MGGAVISGVSWPSEMPIMGLCSLMRALTGQSRINPSPIIV
jgi:hypothetical protein